MKSSPFDTFAFKQSLVDADISEQQANAITQAFSTAIQESNANLIESIKRQYQLNDGVTQYDLRKLELKQDSNFNQFLHEFKMQELQSANEEAKRKTQHWQNLLIAFYVFETLVITFLIAKI